MKLPKAVYSHLGPVPVLLKPGLVNKKGEALNGELDEDSRTVAIDPGSCATTQLVTLFHEAIHIGLMDSGMDNAFNEEQQESICCALGPYFAGAVLAGYLKLCTPK